MTTSERIAELREYARQDGDRCNEGSIADFLAFPSRIAGMEGPYLYMEESGNLRVVYKSNSQRLAIDFYGQGKAKLTLLSLDFQRKGEPSVFSLTGMPPALNEETFVLFVKEHPGVAAEEANQEAMRTA